MITYPQGCNSYYLLKQTRLILLSYQKQTGKELLPMDQPIEALTERAFKAPFVLVSAGIEDDPILDYGNESALKRWEMDWKTFTKTQSKETAEPMERGERKKFLKNVREKGYIDNYQGIRVSKSGRRFEIKNATVWNLLNGKGEYAGQAATFFDWNYID